MESIFNLNRIILFFLLFLIQVSAQELNKTDLANQYLSEAEKFMTDEKLDSAFVFYKKAGNLFYEQEEWKKFFRCEIRQSAIYTRKREFESSLKKIDEIILKSNEVFKDTNDAIAYANFMKGNVFLRQQNFDKAIETFHKAIKLEKEIHGDNTNDLADMFNNLGNAHFYISKYTTAIEYWKKSLKIRIELNGAESASVADNYNNIGLAFQVLSEYEKSLEYYNKSIRIRKEIYGERHPEVSSSYINSGIVYLELSEFDKALENYKKALEIRLEVYGEMHPLTADCYNNIGTVYYETGEIDLSLEYLLKSLEIRRKTLGDEHTSVAESYGNVGNAYKERKNYLLALEYNQKARSIFQNVFGDENLKVGENLNNIGLDYKNLSKYDKALQSYNKALEIYKKLFGEKQNRISETYNNLGQIYSLQGEYKKALEIQKRALQMQYELLGEYNKNVAQTLNLIGDVFSKIAQKDSANFYYQKAIMTNMRIDKKNSFNSIFNEKEHQYFSYIELLKSVTGILEIDKSGEISIKILDFADQIIKKTRKEIYSIPDKIALGEIASRIYEQGVLINYKMFENTNDAKFIENGFYFSEQNKASILSLILENAKAKKFSNVPDSLIKYEKYLQAKISFYSQRLLEVENDEKKVDYQTNLFEFNRKYEILQNELKEKFLKYYQIKNNNFKTELQTAKEITQKEALIISYQITDNNLFIFTIENENLNVVKINIDSTFTANVGLFLNSIKTAELEELKSSNEILQNILISPIEKQLINKNKIIIIPDGILSEIPFEVLFQAKNNQNEISDLHYMIEDYEIVYSPSLSIYLSNGIEKKSTIVSSMNFTGFAPVVFNKQMKSSENEIVLRSLDSLMRSSVLDSRGNLFDLPYSEKEIEKISTLFESNENIRLNSKATETCFKKIIQENAPDIVHISTHSLANRNTPALSCIVFSEPIDSTENDGFLFSGETYNLELGKTKLLVLSSCESGMGKIVKGEGMLSLTRGFLYSGAKNIIYSLWKINDQFTSEFMNKFYENMVNQQKPIAKALRDAKIEMIKKSVFPGQWAAFVLIEN